MFNENNFLSAYHDYVSWYISTHMFPFIMQVTDFWHKRYLWFARQYHVEASLLGRISVIKDSSIHWITEYSLNYRVRKFYSIAKSINDFYTWSNPVSRLGRFLNRKKRGAKWYKMPLTASVYMLHKQVQCVYCLPINAFFTLAWQAQKNFLYVSPPGFMLTLCAFIFTFQNFQLQENLYKQSWIHIQARVSPLDKDH